MFAAHVRSAGGAAIVAVFVALVGASSATAAPVIVNNGTYTSGNASFQETGAVERDGGGNRRVDATFVVNVDPGRNITQVVGDGISASFSQDSGSSNNTRIVHATFNLTNYGNHGCNFTPWSFNTTRRVSRTIGWRVVDNAGSSSGTVNQNLKIIEDDGCNGVTDFPVLEASDHTVRSDLAPGASVPFGFRCDDADGSGAGDRCDEVHVRWRRLNDGVTEHEGTFDAEDNVERNYTASAPTARGVWVLEGQLDTESGVEDGDYWRLARVRINGSTPSAGTVAFEGAQPSNPPSVNPGAGVTAVLGGYSSEAQVVSWSGTTANGASFSGNPFLSGGNLANPALTAAQTRRGVSTSTPGLKTVGATVTDHGAIDAADSTRNTASTSGQLRVNAPPTASGQSVAVTEDTPRAITLVGDDPDDQPLSALRYEIVSGPSKGSISGGTAATRTYTPSADATGSDSFTFRVSDGPSGSSAYASSGVATVTINIAAVNDAPIASDLSVSTTEDTPRGFTLPATDPDGQSLTYTITQQPSKGSVSCSGATCTYTPSANATGADELVFRASDGALSDTGRVRIQIVPVNDAPVASDQRATTAEDTPASIALAVSDVDGDALDVDVVSPPAHGAVVVHGTTVAYAPGDDFNGSDTFTYRVSDGQASDTAEVTIDVEPVNDAPVAGGGSVTTDEDAPAEFGLTGTDVDGDDLTFTVVAQPTHGSLSCEPDGRCTYTPATNFFGTDTFTYRVSDGQASDQGQVTIHIRPVNDPPVARSQSAATDEDTPVAITLDVEDVDGTPLQVTVLTGPAHGAVTVQGTTVSYTPDENFHGTDALTYRVTDPDGASATATVSIGVAAVNDPPVARDQTVATPEDEAVGFTLAGEDVDDGDLTFTVGEQPAHGQLSCGSDGHCTYTPAANFFGTDTFTYAVSDGDASASADVTIEVTPVNDAPVGQDAEASTDEDTPVDIPIQATDIDSAELTYAVGGTAPSKGSVTFDGNVATYTPDADANGDDEFTVVVSDGELTDEVTVAVTIRPVNDAPVANAQLLFVDEDGVLLIELSGSDVEGDELTHAIVDGPAHGQLQCNASGACAYRPDHDFSGDDGFTFRVSDGQLESAAATVDVVVRPVNDAPVVRDETAATDEDEPVDVAIDATDVDDAELELTIGRQPSRGTVTLSGSTATYTPHRDANGQDEFTVVASDGELTGEGTVRVTVRPVNDAPTAGSQAVFTPEDEPVGITLAGADVDGDELTFTADQPHVGEVACDGADCTYTPPADFHGETAFDYTVSDGHGGTATGSVSVLVTAVNDAPVAEDQSASTAEDTPVEVALDVGDVDGDTLSASATGGPSHGTVTFDGTTATYSPAPDFHGEDAFTYLVTDPSGETASATVTVTVSAVNDAPTVAPASATTPEDTGVTIQLTAGDVDGDTLTYAATSPEHGTATCSDGSCRYEPAPDYHGQDAFEVTVADPSGASATAPVSITVEPVNDAPVAEDLALGTDEDTEVEFSLQATDVDGDPLTYAVADDPDHGTVACLAQSCRYRPDPDYHGTDELTYTVTDGGGLSDTATVRIAVGEVSYPTRVTAEPMVFVTQRQNGTLLGSLGIQVRLLKVRAQLTRADTGAPVPGEPMSFRSGSVQLCTATTGSDGWATCMAPVLSFPATLLSGGYTAHYAGDQDHHASQGSAPTIGL